MKPFLLPVLILLAAAAAALPAAAAPVDPGICTDPDVLQHLQDRLLPPHPGTRILPETITAAPGQDDTHVTCALYTIREVVDSAAPTPGPSVIVEAHVFQVRRLAAGFEVTRAGIPLRLR